MLVLELEDANGEVPGEWARQAVPRGFGGTVTFTVSLPTRHCEVHALRVSDGGRVIRIGMGPVNLRWNEATRAVPERGWPALAAGGDSLSLSFGG